MKKIKTLLKIILMLVIGYAMIVFLVPFWKGAGATRPNSGINIQVISYDAYSTIVLPAKKPYDWQTFFPNEGKEKSPYYAMFTWKTNEKTKKIYGQYWLSPFGLAEGALSVRYSRSTYASMMTTSSFYVTNDEYSKLVDYIKNSVVTENEQLIPLEKHYVANDYKVNTKPNLFYNGTTWANNALKEAQVATAVWTILPFGIHNHFEQ